MGRDVIVYRAGRDWDAEKAIASQWFPCLPYRPQVKAGDRVIGRFSCLPFYYEQQEEYRYLEASLINTYTQHNYIADLTEWYADLMEFTPRTWTRLQDLPEKGPFVLKGRTNSKKFRWSTHMFAADKKEAIAVHSRLEADSVIGTQDIVIREYVPLVRYLTGIQSLPVTKEFRIFCYKDAFLSKGYYWSNYVADLEERGIEPRADIPISWLSKIMNIVSKRTNYYALDVAQTESGEWIVIELNDGQMSGLSENDPNKLYEALHRELSVERQQVPLFSHD